jgi:hypothetical protein
MMPSAGRAAAQMAASVTATSVLPVPPKPEPTVTTPDLSDGSRIAAITWRRRFARLASGAFALAGRDDKAMLERSP